MRQRDRFGSFIADVRYALRQAKRAPGFTMLAIGTLALGIGATTTMFTLVDDVLLRPLPFPHPERLMMVFGADSAKNEIQEVSSADWLDWRRAQGLESSALYSFLFRQGIIVGDSAVRVDAEIVFGRLLQGLLVPTIHRRPRIHERRSADRRCQSSSSASDFGADSVGADPRLDDATSNLRPRVYHRRRRRGKEARNSLREIRPLDADRRSRFSRARRE